MTNYQTLWEQIRDEFKNHVSPTTYATWIKPVIPVALNKNQLILELPSPLHRDYWKAKLSPRLVEYAYKITQTDITPKFVLKEELQQKQQMEQSIQSANQSVPTFKKRTHLNPNYTFQKFVVGKGNQMAHAAALVVSDDPGKMYDPLLIYGGVGLGKTHLMQAIGNRIMQKDPKKRVKYVTSEAFTNDFVKSVQQHKSEKFRKEYRDVDVLLVDDIEFFADKGGTQEEFFHTFNDLYDDGKQIVLTSDRLPNEIPKLQDRLVSRFAWGLSVDITRPDLATRIAILKSKAKFAHIRIPNNCLEYIAQSINSNVRELEGALSRVKAYARFRQASITLSLTKNALHGLDIQKANSKAISIPAIQKMVASYFNVSVRDIKGKKRVKTIVIPRQIAMYLSREITKTSLPKIGKAFGGKDHTTVIHAYDKIKKNLKTNPDIQNYVEDLKGELQR
ncbi:chromosomal replication initiator protein DnaA [Acetilactobacillus jinshanensis]|uniref:Chromosomal replication initiator protein DnaA n=1 Tax=Acetilactobacillus jinshanensis TaxID=1720083 RepID=A0A4P6ZIS4_9LACO|nr:chromosomal replication initiator protein DnaA [Acetilactobacillus jinshanensis]QBP17601.1 chromosomal replication initiator protein DnaA [Acetilactobacillus jinshanensis]URL60477.1 chromosomal replication initiator protein DnaA [uncultured bacterium]